MKVLTLFSQLALQQCIDETVESVVSSSPRDIEGATGGSATACLAEPTIGRP
jgi:hypothetical protein